jgi:hypothetical protein
MCRAINYLHINDTRSCLRGAITIMRHRQHTHSQIISVKKRASRANRTRVRNDIQVIIDAPNSNNYHRGLLPLHGARNRVSIFLSLERREHLASHARCNFSFTRPQHTHPPRLLDALNCPCLSNLASSLMPPAAVKRQISHHKFKLENNHECMKRCMCAEPRIIILEF